MSFIVLKLNSNTNSIYITTSITNSFSNIFNIFKNKEHLRFLYDGERLNNDESPLNLNMEHGDEIDILNTQIGGGVPYLFYNLYNKFNRSKDLLIDAQTLKNIDINALFFDFNGICHPCAQQILSANYDKYISIEDENERVFVMERDIIQNTIDYTKTIINKMNVKNIYIIIDGVAPSAKMVQQRERRYKSEFFKVDNSEKSSLWDSNKITPGTLFMSKLSESLMHFKNNSNLNVFISDSNICGEGEHMIVKLISELNFEKQKIAIYGLDGDLIFISMLNKLSDSIILIRDTTFASDEVKRSLDYVDISCLKGFIYTDFVNTLKTKHNCKFVKENLIQDYSVIAYLLGNDFLEHIPNISIKTGGIDTLIKAYTNAWKDEYLIKDDKSINLVFLKDIFYQLKNHESYFFKNFRLDTLVKPELKTLEQLELSDRLSFYKDDILKMNQPGYKERYYLYYNIKKSEINDACLNYLQGLSWVLGYYNGHSHNNWTWYYKYHSVPFSSDLFEYLRSTSNIEQSLNIKSDQPVSNIKQLCLVLPKDSLITILKENNTITDKLYNFITTCDKYYPDNLYIDIINKKYLWQSKIFFENIDENIIDLFLN
jgi:5'-3' exonuclease